MLYENIEMSGSLEVTGSFIVPFGTSSVTGSYEKGRMMLEKDSGRLFVWTGSWATIGAQENPQSAPNTVFTNISANLTASVSTGTNLISMSLTEADNITSTPFSASISGSSFEIVWSNADSSSGFIRNTTTLSAGTYYYNVTVFDSGSINSQSYSNQTVTVAAPPTMTADFLVVAGGAGSGQYAWGGAGGAGGLRTSYGSTSGGGTSSESSLTLTSGESYTITVGAGGGILSNGGDSSISGTGITTVTSTGGGRGGNFNGLNAVAGGSGGGGGGGSSAGSGDAGTAGQGYAGGDAAGNVAGQCSGGGGGASAVGGTAAANSSGDGGAGLSVSITGTSVAYAGGGGGAVGRGDQTSETGGVGGTGGGGNGGRNTYYGGSNNADPTAGTANTGGGGGGGKASGNSANSGGGAAGGSGVVILTYPTASNSATGGVRTFFNDRVAHTFNSSGTFTVGGTKTYTHNTLDVFGDSSCIALYTLDGNANDTSGNYNGTTSNVTYSQGYINNGGVFNGSSSKLNTGIVLASTTFSVSVWFNTTVSGKSIIATLDSSAGSVNDRDGFYILSQTYSIFNNDVQIVAGTYNAGDQNDGNWHHIVLTNDGSNSKLYIDGSLDRTDSSSGWNTLGSQDIHLGFIQRSPIVNWFDGKIDQVRIFNKALSSSEVATLYTE